MLFLVRKKRAREGTGSMKDLWYALHVRPRFERYVQTQLQQKGYEVFLPMSISKRKWSDRVKSIEVPLFPSYVFCRFDVSSRLPILVTPGVNFVVGIGKAPHPVDEEEILTIRRVIESRVATQPWPYLKMGQLVTVETGPLEGLRGVVVRAKGSDRLVVSVSLLMRSVSVEIDRNCVKPVTPQESVSADVRFTPTQEVFHPLAAASAAQNIIQNI
jgi:transcription antitermination factor NusG